MPSLFEMLFNRETLLEIIDRVVRHDAYDLRNSDQNFSFLSSVGIIVLFISVFATAHLGSLQAAQGCSLDKLIFISADCANTWLALIALLSVIGVSYLTATLIGTQFSLLRPANAIVENCCSLFILGCFILIAFQTANEGAVFKWVTDTADRWLDTDGTTNNIIAVAAVVAFTLLLSTAMTLVRRYLRFGAIKWGGLEFIILVLFYNVFLMAALSFTFFEFKS